MGLRFHKSINLGKFFRINLSKNGVGYSVGTKGVRVSKSATGQVRETVTVPGTGLSYVNIHKKKKETTKDTKETKTTKKATKKTEAVVEEKVAAFCPECGEQVEGKFCKFCGTKL